MGHHSSGCTSGHLPFFPRFGRSTKLWSHQAFPGGASGSARVKMVSPVQVDVAPSLGNASLILARDVAQAEQRAESKEQKAKEQKAKSKKQRVKCKEFGTKRQNQICRERERVQRQETSVFVFSPFTLHMCTCAPCTMTRIRVRGPSLVSIPAGCIFVAMSRL